MNPEPLKDKLKNGHAPFASFMKVDIRSACEWLKSQSLILQDGDLLVISRFDLEKAFADVYKDQDDWNDTSVGYTTLRKECSK